MKRIFTTALLFISLFAAQAADGSLEELRIQATEQTRTLMQKVGLNEMEYIKIKNLTYSKLLATKEANEMYANDAAMLAKKIQSIEEDYNKNVMATLTPHQHQQYLALNTK